MTRNELMKLNKLSLVKIIIKMQEENERLRNGYCELKEKCNNCQCDCTNEEYNIMCEHNMLLSLKIDKAIEYINTHYLNANEPKLLNILQGSDK